jgi:hypothetical protein
MTSIEGRLDAKTQSKLQRDKKMAVGAVLRSRIRRSAVSSPKRLKRTQPHADKFADPSTKTKPIDPCFDKAIKAMLLL